MPRMALRTTIFKLLLSIISLPLGLAFDPSTRACPDPDLCLTSFIWCAGQGVNVGDQPGCTVPPHVYLYSYDHNNAGSQYALLSSSDTYNISWKKKENYPVRVSWSFQALMDNTSSRKWELYTNESFIMFRPDDVLEQFPTALAPNLSSVEARSFATSDFTNFIEISQPDHPPNKLGYHPGDSSGAFALDNPMIYGFLDTQAEIAREQEYGKWKLGVGIGVGLGIPILMAIAGYIGWMIGRRNQMSFNTSKGTGVESSG